MSDSNRQQREKEEGHDGKQKHAQNEENIQKAEAEKYGGPYWDVGMGQQRKADCRIDAQQQASAKKKDSSKHPLASHLQKESSVEAATQNMWSIHRTTAWRR